ncbi:MAG: PTS system mannose/fructose/sorbose family transporter subunit IID [Erysipelotrichales bacterium]|nr:MAG: PTS system mannose/fructose/sorbose family transporter subunit IID [Erysipelotrichales bacterium]
MSNTFTKKELRSLNFRWIWHSQIGWNYERMQGLGYLTTMIPVMKKLYADKPESMKHALYSHSQFFNTQPAMGDIIVGMNIAIEEAGGEGAIDTATAVKTSLMGPFAGIGDTIFGMIGGTVFGSIAVSTAVEGSFVGIGLWTLWNLFVLFLLRPKMFDLGYSQGIKLVTTMAHQLKALTEGASALGVMVVGAMVATMVNIKFGQVKVAANVFDFQVLADKIMPKLGAALLVGLCYWLLGRKGMNSNKLILVVILIAIVGAFLKLLVRP